MAKTLSADLRSRLIAAVEGSMSRRAASAHFKVGVATAIRGVREFRATGTTAAKPKGGDQRAPRIEAFRHIILGAVHAQVDITLVVRPPARFGGSWQERPDVATRRQAWRDAQPRRDAKHLVFIDQTGASTKMARLRGRANRGERWRAAVPTDIGKPQSSPAPRGYLA
jgi:hypothetical protein